LYFFISLLHILLYLISSLSVSWFA
jgi:hypothetical protein